MLAALAVFAVSAVASASASAVEFQICAEGGGSGTKYSEHKCTTEEASGKWEWVTFKVGLENKVVSKGGEFKLTAGTKVITCKKVKDEGLIAEGGAGEATAITFEECSTSEAKCLVKSKGGTNGKVVVTAVPTQLVEREPSGGGTKKLANEFKQNATTKEFVTLQFEKEGGGTCSTLPETKVKGQVAAEAINLATSGEAELNFPSPELKGNSLEAFGVAAKLTGKDTEILSNAWGVRALK
ncbi:MAG TPA: hypothetical protein VGX26_10330 [Solirubrobacteraceae bacterium]|jgi:hypothetical protein|nr:hypothetical protein [Solirubrobacteraceae bacterium]